jgi:predicted alpha/beta-hydrolase family hydrolase
MLSAGVLDRSFDLAAAGPIAASSDAAPEAVAPPPAANQPAIGPHGRAYLFRGALGPIFSRGMDRLTERLEQAGIRANVYEFTICRLIAEQAIRDYRNDPAPIALIGHSMGGLCALKFAEMLQAESIRVNLVVTIDPAHASPSVPLNVERFINIFLSDNVLGGGDVRPVQGYQGHYASFDLAKHDEVTHINIDKMDSVHQQLVAMIVQLAALTFIDKQLFLYQVIDLFHGVFVADKQFRVYMGGSIDQACPSSYRLYTGGHEYGVVIAIASQ